MTGVDLGAPMLEVARSQSAGEGAAEITYLEGSADSLPLDDDEFDVAVCQQGRKFIPDRPAALAEMRRVLRSGGRLGIATWAALERNPVLAVIATGLARNLGEETGQMMHAPFSLHDADELRGLAEDGGFREGPRADPRDELPVPPGDGEDDRARRSDRPDVPGSS